MVATDLSVSTARATSSSFTHHAAFHLRGKSVYKFTRASINVRARVAVVSSIQVKNSSQQLRTKRSCSCRSWHCIRSGQ